MADFVLAVDQGTTSTRAIIFDGDGIAVAVAQREFPPDFSAPRLGRARSGRHLATTLATMREALAERGLPASDIAAIGITNQRETTLIWDRTTRPRRSQRHRLAGPPHGRRLRGTRREGAEPLVSERTGLLLDPYFSATKIGWMLDHVEGARARAERGELAFGTVDTFLLWRLTGGAVHATDATNASRTLLCDIQKGAWDDDLLKLFGVPRAMLPEMKQCRDDFGATDAALFGARTPDSRHRRRSAGRADRPGLFHARHAQIDLWHWLLPRSTRAPAVTSRIGCSPLSPINSMASAPTPWKARSSWRARPCNGCAMG